MDIVVKNNGEVSHIYIFVDRSDETNLLIENVTTVAKNKEEGENKHKSPVKEKVDLNKDEKNKNKKTKG